MYEWYNDYLSTSVRCMMRVKLLLVTHVVCRLSSLYLLI